MSSLTRAPAERAQRGVAERRHVFLTEHVRLPISKGQLDESEYDGRRPGSYAMNPLRGARAAALASGVNMHVGASRRDMSFPSDLEPEWRCLGGDNGRQLTLICYCHLVGMVKIVRGSTSGTTMKHHYLAIWLTNCTWHCRLSMLF